MSRLRTILLGDGGPGAAAGMVLLFGFGLALTISGAVELGEWFRKEPRELPCRAALLNPPSQWCALTGCRLDLAAASGDGGTRLVALAPATESLDGGATLRVEVRDPALVSLADQLSGLPRGEADAVVQAAPAEVKALLLPDRLTGHLEADGASWRLTRGKPLPSGRSLVAFFLGTLVLGWAFRPLAIRWLLVRER